MLFVFIGRIMNVKAVEFAKYTVLIEYEMDNKIERCYLPREIINTSKRGWIQIPKYYLNYGIPFSDVDLISSLGSIYKNIQVNELEQVLRKAGFWRREDYRQRIGDIQTILQVNNIKNIDSTLIVNSAYKE